MLNVILITIYLIFCFVLHLILHELGHLIFGKLSGYDFISFRIANVMFIKQNSKLIRKKYKVAGTVGQCLMSPPEPVNKKYPYILYNLGGVLINIISSGVCCLGYLLLSSSHPELARILLIFTIVGLFFGLTNIIPEKSGGVATDGFNALNLGKDENARRAFWVQLRINALAAQGFRIRDMPVEWFRMPSDDQLSDVMVASVAVCGVGYLIDKQEFDEAKKLAEHLLITADKMLEIHKNELRCELLFLEIIGECRKEKIDQLYTKHQHIFQDNDFYMHMQDLYLMITCKLKKHINNF